MVILSNYQFQELVNAVKQHNLSSPKPNCYLRMLGTAW